MASVVGHEIYLSALLIISHRQRILQQIEHTVDVVLVHYLSGVCAVDVNACIHHNLHAIQLFERICYLAHVGIIERYEPVVPM